MGFSCRATPLGTIAQGNTTNGTPGPGASCVGSGVETLLYSITPLQFGTATLSLMPNAGVDLALFVFTSCANATTSQVACVDNGTAGGPEVASFAVAAGTTYYVAVSSVGAGGGAFTLTVLVF